MAYKAIPHYRRIETQIPLTKFFALLALTTQFHITEGLKPTLPRRRILHFTFLQSNSTLQKDWNNLEKPNDVQIALALQSNSTLQKDWNPNLGLKSLNNQLLTKQFHITEGLKQIKFMRLNIYLNLQSNSTLQKDWNVSVLSSSVQSVLLTKQFHITEGLKPRFERSWFAYYSAYKAIPCNRRIETAFQCPTCCNYTKLTKQFHVTEGLKLFYWSEHSNIFWKSYKAIPCNRRIETKHEIKKARIGRILTKQFHVTEGLKQVFVFIGWFLNLTYKAIPCNRRIETTTRIFQKRQ